MHDTAAVPRNQELNLLPKLKKGTSRALKSLGLRVQRYGTPNLTWACFFEEVKARGFRPDAIIDVGVAWGTPDLYEAFPDAAYFLVEPLRQMQPALDALRRRLNATVINAAAGASPGRMTITVAPTMINSSAFAAIVANPVSSYEVDVVRLDQAIDLPHGATLLKVDVEGGELAVVEGCAGFLDRIDMVILETSLISPEPGIPEFGDVVAAMKSRGFVVYGVIGGVKRPLDHALWQVDLVFVPERHALRRDRRWE